MTSVILATPMARRSPTTDLIFTARQIADILGSPLANVEIMWPLLAQAFQQVGQWDRAVAIATAATIGVEAKRFWPIEEYRNADGSAPWYWQYYNGGALYHGRSLIQLTHQYNYQKAGDFIGVDLVDNPALALLPEYAAPIFVWYCTQARDIPSLARRGLWRDVRVAVNGINEDGEPNGLDEFLGYVRALEAL